MEYSRCHIWDKNGFHKLTNIPLSYTVTPWKTPEDLLHVKSICTKYGCNMNIGCNDCWSNCNRALDL